MITNKTEGNWMLTLAQSLALLLVSLNEPKDPFRRVFRFCHDYLVNIRRPRPYHTVNVFVVLHESIKQKY